MSSCCKNKNYNYKPSPIGVLGCSDPMVRTKADIELIKKFNTTTKENYHTLAFDDPYQASSYNIVYNFNR